MPSMGTGGPVTSDAECRIKHQLITFKAIYSYRTRLFNVRIPLLGNSLNLLLIVFGVMLGRLKLVYFAGLFVWQVKLII